MIVLTTVSEFRIGSSVSRQFLRERYVKRHGTCNASDDRIDNFCESRDDSRRQLFVNFPPVLLQEHVHLVTWNRRVLLYLESN